ncbi:hypothetical protein B0T14DRAFT_519924 [Immersiella caudata]|uniref:Uncharacterized protein n=1 Tax=Immersiella caudata TaxID=314043 RepID=A0AA40C070_9PEZI|nr:hypothetical protein B0T14DRAFT_519924 [Immersiella caudata]
MSSSPLPVPRKVALTAVRGLLVGTSCTLALVAEDRRRKINNAIRVIENGEKIKSARSYHGSSETGSSTPKGKEDRVPLDPFETVLLKYGVSPGDEGRKERKSKKKSLDTGADEAVSGPGARRRETPSEAHETGAPAANAAAAPLEGNGIPLELPERGHRPHTDRRETGLLDDPRLKSLTEPAEMSTTRRKEPSAKRALFEASRESSKSHLISSRSSPLVTKRLGWIGHARTTRRLAEDATGSSRQLGRAPCPEMLKSVAARTSTEVLAMVQTACRTSCPHPPRVAEAVQGLISICEGQRPLEDPDEWVQTSVLLCRTCQDLGLVAEAETVYRAIQGKVMLSPEDNLAHNPFSLINSFIELANRSSRRETRGAYLDTAIGIYTTPLTSKPSPGNKEASDTGVALVEALFRINYVWRVCDVFTRCVEYAEVGHHHKLANRFMSQLLDRGEYKKAINFFIARHQQFRLEGVVLDRTVQAVQQAHGYRPSDALRCLVKACSGVCNLRLDWIAKLLQADWDRFHEFDRIEELFKSHLAPDLEQITKSPERVYRLMIEMALMADDVGKARAYLITAAARNAEVLTDPLWLGLFAKHAAKEDNWEAVRKLFEEMDASTAERSESLATMFVPVLKLYAKRHQLDDTERFVDLYTNRLNVPLCPYTVTLMMSQYAAARDTDRIIEWLERYRATDFKNATLSNAVLDACRKMKMPFRDIRTIYRKLQAIDPHFADEHTEKMMAEAALWGTSLNGNVGAGRRARGRVLSMRLRLTNTSKSLACKGRPVAEHNLVLAMKDAMVIGGHAKALWIYKRALLNGMRPSGRVLRLAVRAELNMPNREDRSVRIQELLRRAKLQGQDVHYVTNQVIALSLKEISSLESKQKICSEVRATIEHFEGVGIVLSDAVFNWAAHACMKAGRFAEAIYYAHRAVGCIGLNAKPCYNIHNFKMLLMCYVELLDVEKIRDTIGHGLDRPYSGERHFKVALQQARRRAGEAGSASDVANASDDVFAERRDGTIQVISEGIARAVKGRSALAKERKRFEEEALRIIRQAALDTGSVPVDFDTIPWLVRKPLKIDPGAAIEEVMLKRAVMSI